MLSYSERCKKMELSFILKHNIELVSVSHKSSSSCIQIYAHIQQSNHKIMFSNFSKQSSWSTVTITGFEQIFAWMLFNY